MRDIVERWLARDPDPQTQAELRALLDGGNEAELQQRFSGRLAFGTAGLRGLIGAGPQRMNRLVVRETTAGLGQYLLRELPQVKERGVLIGYDGRRGSEVFAQDAAAVLVALGIKVFLGEHVLPTPVCAFGVKHHNAAAGVVITASHNPPDYNGYKVYWENGAQIIPPHDIGIAAAIDQAATGDLPFTEIQGDHPLITRIGPQLMSAYLAEVAKLSTYPHQAGRADFPLAYTPLHGVGAQAVERALAQAGFTQVHTVTNQREPDGNFPTVRFPNPEEEGAMDEVLALAQKVEAPLALANDPDADRLAVAVRDPSGAYQMLSGNQIGVLLGADQLARGKGKLAVATTIVSSRMLGRMAAKAGATYFETLTGFKWIANGALEREAQDPELRFVFGYEEALGYTIGTLVRDKDGVSSLVAFAEMAAALHQQGKSVLHRLEELYREHGLFLTGQRTLALDPHAKGPSLGNKLRAQPPTTIAGRAVTSVTDFITGFRTAGGQQTKVELPASDVVMFDLEDDSRVIIRPSGTEPKIKCYYEVVGEVSADFAAAQRETQQRLETLMDQHQAELATLE